MESTKKYIFEHITHSITIIIESTSYSEAIKMFKLLNIPKESDKFIITDESSGKSSGWREQAIKHLHKKEDILRELKDKELENAASKWAKENHSPKEPDTIPHKEGFMAGATWRQEQMVNEAIEFHDWCNKNTIPYSSLNDDMASYINLEEDIYVPMTYKQLYEVWKTKQ